MKIFKDFAQILTLEGAYKKDGRNLEPSDNSIIEDGAVVFDDKIIWVGNTSDIPSDYLEKASEIQSFKGHVLTPELVDSHTHIVFAGNRANEYMMRLDGADYQEIAKAGGGILSTMSATNEATDEELFKLSVERIERLNSYGIGSIEIKSGYSLTYDGEKRCSVIIDRLKKHFAGRVNIFNTFLAAHAVPKTYESSSKYLSEVVIPLLNELAPKGIIDAVDIFHEEGYFSLDDVKTLFDIAKGLNLKLKIHADEFNDNKGALTASNYSALSADHLLCTTEDGIKSLANSKTVATVLPGTGWFLGKPQANAKLMVDQGCKLAIASDYNPGSCHFDNLLQIASMAAPMYPLNSAQMWSAITLNSAHALGLFNQGAIVNKLDARFSIFKVNSISEITYNWGRNFAVTF